MVVFGRVPGKCVTRKGTRFRVTYRAGEIWGDVKPKVDLVGASVGEGAWRSGVLYI